MASVRADDGARSELMLLWPKTPVRQALYWLPAMGVPARHYLDFARALAAHGVVVALHEWRGLGSSERRASRQCDWGYRELLTQDLPAGLAAARARVPDAQWCLAGHSLGGQLATLYAGLRPQSADGLVLVASGAPWWRAFPGRWRVGLRIAFLVAPLLSRLFGHFPGRRVGFGGREAHGVMLDWTRSGRTGRYAASGLEVDLEAALAELHWPVLALRMQDDPLCPAGSLNWLLRKLAAANRETHVLSARNLGCSADHFAWIRNADAVAGHIAAWLQRAHPDAQWRDGAVESVAGASPDRAPHGS